MKSYLIAIITSHVTYGQREKRATCVVWIKRKLNRESWKMG